MVVNLFARLAPLVELGKRIQELGLDIITYTGHTFEYLVDNANEDNRYLELLSITDFLIDGKFEINNKSYLLKFRVAQINDLLIVKKFKDR